MINKIKDQYQNTTKLPPINAVTATATVGNAIINAAAGLATTILPRLKDRLKQPEIAPAVDVPSVPDVTRYTDAIKSYKESIAALRSRLGDDVQISHLDIDDILFDIECDMIDILS
jgi:hypothetical protein